jgi:hypothetical protein
MNYPPASAGGDYSCCLENGNPVYHIGDLAYVMDFTELGKVSQIGYTWTIETDPISGLPKIVDPPTAINAALEMTVTANGLLIT